MAAPDVFLSYNREDAGVASRYAEAFAAEGLNVWWDTALRSGEAYDEVTEAALRGAKAVVVLWSPRSVVSRWVRAEATIADRCKTLVPVTIETCERPIMFELTQTADLAHWTGDAQDRAWLAFLGDVRRFVEREADKPTPVQLATATEFAPPNKPSIALLPFTNLGSADQDFFADGMVEEISNLLSRFRGLFVIAGQTSLSYRGTAKTAQHIARELGVRYLLEGSVRKAASKIRIAVKLIDGTSGAQIWAERFDDDLDDIFDLQDRIAGQVTKAIDVTIGDSEIRRVASRPTQSLTAYELVLRANTCMQAYTRESLAEGIGLTERAMELDPNYALAAAWSGLLHGSTYLNRWSNHPEAHKQAALDHMDQALRLNNDDTVVLTLMAGTMIVTGADPATIGQMIDRAVASNPGSPMLPFWVGWASSLNGNARRGAEMFEEALRVNPMSNQRIFALAGLGLCLFWTGRHEEAVSVLTEATRLAPDHAPALAALAASLSKTSKPAEARIWLDRLNALGGIDLVLPVVPDPAQRAMLLEEIAIVEEWTA
jgi:TolB-like protein/Tfp pilus assembly protein PilF